MTQQPKQQRADAIRNRAKVLEVAYAMFAADGLQVPIDEIARGAGVGAGTVYRHFPTKDALYGAIVVDRIDRVVQHALALATDHEPGEALFSFLVTMVAEGNTDHGLVEALAGAGFDIARVAPQAEARFMAALGDLVAAAQCAGAVRSDVDVHVVKVLLVGCQAMQRYSQDIAVTSRILDIIRAGLST